MGRAYFKQDLQLHTDSLERLAIGQLTMQELYLLHCTFGFYNCTNCDKYALAYALVVTVSQRKSDGALQAWSYGLYVSRRDMMLPPLTHNVIRTP